MAEKTFQVPDDWAAEQRRLLEQKRSQHTIIGVAPGADDEGPSLEETRSQIEAMKQRLVKQLRLRAVG